MSKNKDEFVCDNCGKSTLGLDGICIACGYDSYEDLPNEDDLLDNPDSEEEDEEYEDDADEFDVEIEEDDTGLFSVNPEKDLDLKNLTVSED